ncbi:hypothetical protein FRZ67_16140 [Panacibacter ginsenosidivorans]|uniref:Uncharacterized protein n=1 Tax=Panacibacter ginsenosidivorans TaxID=1813871 RepID=A0A5B8VBW0_9BACT|nr:hypothetical protein [Panacibacter ginsenosidivorans]QEC68759.1 hypothetical protein FRZ67_16140 [Panacibacter ginsenosidivorans]
MRFDKNLIIILGVSVLSAFVCFLLMINVADRNDSGIIVILGWIFWLGIYTTLLPVFVNPKFARNWFEKDFFWATILLNAAHIILIIAAGYYAAKILNKW